MEFGTDAAAPMNCVDQALERAPKPRPLVGGVKKELADFALETAPSLSLKTLSALDKAYHPPHPSFPIQRSHTRQDNPASTVSGELTTRKDSASHPLE